MEQEYTTHKYNPPVGMANIVKTKEVIKKKASKAKNEEEKSQKKPQPQKEHKSEENRCRVLFE